MVEMGKSRSWLNITQSSKKITSRGRPVDLKMSLLRKYGLVPVESSPSVEAKKWKLKV